ncbi:biotin--[acetyl-CoA-carboxylase] ligase [Carboxylicivirga sp. N1Y90]|uniref:biotin--[acetyl-CoA-carboxylase] ligase n=1 Tax=Carboxylicivirga fragile TaxID=3417571 RepID=UPI003D3579A2|nr:biotin--[acetyl-CoA-carboxylase] ligase [Marinilabiliaceae bacterium N1Y90]
MTSYFEPNYIRYDELPSTNTELKKLIDTKDVREGTVVICRNQNDGKGQANNSWESEKGKNLTFSLLLRPNFLEPHKQFYVSKIISLAIIDALSEFICGITVKWPNDIYIGDKKIAGILIENSIMGAQLDYCIIGIGLNVNQTVFTSDAPNPVSLKSISLTEFDLDKVLDSILKHIQIRYKQLQSEDLDSINSTYFSLLYRNIGKHLFKDEQETFKASIKGVDEMGLLTLKDTSGQMREYAFKEVQFII